MAIKGNAFKTVYQYLLGPAGGQPIKLEDEEDPFEVLFEAVDLKQGWVIYTLVEPQADWLKSDPRFDELIEKLGLTPYK